MNFLDTVRRRMLWISRSKGWTRYGSSVSYNDVLNSYRFILGREPENNDVVAEALLHHKNLHQLRQSFLNSPEFRDQYKAISHELVEQPYASSQRPAVAFIHLLKTAGTSFHALLQQRFPADRICPVRYNHLHLYSAAELCRFDLFSGHFDWFSTEFIPRDNIRRIAILRNPQDRLISFYRFAKSHPPIREYENYVLVQLAHELTAEEYFEHPTVRATPEICNHYLLVFGLAYAQVQAGWPPKQGTVDQAIIDRAKQRIRALDGVGISERFSESVAHIFRALGFPAPKSIASLQVTDNLPRSDARYTPVAPVIMTARLAEAIRDLTAYDTVIYQEALSEFERRRTRELVIEGAVTVHR